jgi:DNA adenine methylase
MTFQGGNIEEDGKLLKPFFNRAGSKVPLIRDVLEIMPPHTTYVEAFVGGGALFWNKIPAKKSVINDLDKELIEGYRILKRIPTSVDMTILDNSKQVGNKYPAVEKFINSVTSKSSDRDKLLAVTEKYAGTFGSMGQGGIYKNPSMENRWKKIDQYKALLKPTTIVSKDYLKVLKDYDSPTTFFFLDPPYEVEKKGQEKYYKHSIIDYDKMNATLKQLKGKFLLTINDSKYISDIFKDFNQKTLIVRNPSQSGISKEAQNRKELFISNYDMKIGKGIETDLFEEEGVVSIPEFRSVKLDLPTFMYKRIPDSKGKPPPYRFRLIIPITKSRNLSSRKLETSLNLSQKPISKPSVQVLDNGDRPTINEFSRSDREKIQEYYSNVKANEDEDPDDIEKDFYQVIPRGFPLPCDGAEERKLKPSEKLAKAVRVIEPKSVKTTKGSDANKEARKGSLVAARVANIEKKTKAQKEASEPKKAVGRPKKERKKVTLEDNSTDLFANLVAKANEPEEVEEATDEDLDLYLLDREAFNKKFGVGLAENKISTNNKMPNKWITYVKEYASKNGMSYRDALKDPKCKAGYKTGGMLETMGHQSRLLAHSFNDSELGANAGKKYISL